MLDDEKPYNYDINSELNVFGHYDHWIEDCDHDPEHKRVHTIPIDHRETALFIIRNGYANKHFIIINQIIRIIDSYFNTTPAMGYEFFGSMAPLRSLAVEEHYRYKKILLEYIAPELLSKLYE